MLPQFVNKTIITVLFFFVITFSLNAQEKMMKMHDMKGGHMMDMHKMMTNMNQMNDQMNSIIQQMKQYNGKIQHSKETMSFMNNMNDMGKYMHSMLDKMNQMTNNQEMMKDKKMHEHLNSIMGNMNPLMNNYKEMMNHFSDDNKKN